MPFCELSQVLEVFLGDNDLVISLSEVAANQTPLAVLARLLAGALDLALATRGARIRGAPCFQLPERGSFHCDDE